MFMKFLFNFCKEEGIQTFPRSHNFSTMTDFPWDWQWPSASPRPLTRWPFREKIPRVSAATRESAVATTTIHSNLESTAARFRISLSDFFGCSLAQQMHQAGLDVMIYPPNETKSGLGDRWGKQNPAIWFCLPRRYVARNVTCVMWKNVPSQLRPPPKKS